MRAGSSWSSASQTALILSGRLPDTVKSAGGCAFLFVLANDCPRGPLLMFRSFVALPAPVRNRPAAQHRPGVSLADPLAQVCRDRPANEDDVLDLCHLVPIHMSRSPAEVRDDPGPEKTLGAIPGRTPPPQFLVRYILLGRACAIDDQCEGPPVAGAGPGGPDRDRMRTRQ